MFICQKSLAMPKGHYKDDLPMLSVSASTRVVATFPRSCKNKTSDMDVAASAAAVFMKSEVLIINDIQSELSLKDVFKNTGDVTEAQKKSLLEYRRSLYRMKQSAEQKIKFIESARNGMTTAESLALKDFAVHHKNFFNCYNEMGDVYDKVRTDSNCRDCAYQINETLEIMTEYKDRDVTLIPPTTSIQKSIVQRHNDELTKETKKACATPFCALKALPLREACKPLNETVKKWNSVVCDPNKMLQSITNYSPVKLPFEVISELVMSSAYANQAEKIKQLLWDKKNNFALLEKNKKAEFSFLKKNIAYHADNLVTFIRDRVLLYATVKAEMNIAIGIIADTIKDLDEKIKDVEKTLAKFTDNLENLEIADNSKLNEITAPLGFNQCLNPDCKSNIKVFKSNLEDLAGELPAHLGVYKDLAQAADNLQQGKINQQVLQNIGNINKKSTYLKQYNEALNGKVKEDFKKNGIPFLYNKEVAKLLNDKKILLGKIASNPDAFPSIAASGIKGPDEKDEEVPLANSNNAYKIESPNVRLIARNNKKATAGWSPDSEEESEEELLPSASSEEKKNPAYKVVPNIYHKSDKSIWHVISKAYYKIFFN